VQPREGVAAAFGVAVLIILGAGAGCSPASPAAASIFETMRDLATTKALSRDVVERALEADLSVDPNSHEMVTYFSGSPRVGSRFERTVKSIDFRVPTPRNQVMRDPFLVVELRDAAGITADDAERILGRPGGIDVPEPNGYTSISYKYVYGPHGLWLGIGHEPARLVRSVSVHRNEER
jgi:hypothetical protein